MVSAICRSSTDILGPLQALCAVPPPPAGDMQLQPAPFHPAGPCPWSKQHPAEQGIPKTARGLLQTHAISSYQAARALVVGTEMKAQNPRDPLLSCRRQKAAACPSEC